MKPKEYINQVILNLIQDLQRLPLALLNSMRGRCQIKFGMTSLYNNGGFTLIELLVVVLIIGILAAVAVPQYQIAVEKANLSRYMALTDAIYKAQHIYYLANGEYADNFDKLDIELPVSTDCRRETVEKATDRYFCDTLWVSLADNISNIQAGDIKNNKPDIFYVRFLRDLTDTTGNFKKDSNYCFGRSLLARKACKALGGEKIGDNSTFEYYLMPL